MGARHHHLHARLQARGNHHLAALDAAHLHTLRLHGGTGRIEAPDHGRTLLLPQRRGRQLQGGLGCRCPGIHGHIGRRAQIRLGLALQTHLHAVGARDRVGTGSYLTHRGRQPLGRGPDAHLHRLSHGDLTARTFGHGDHRIARPIVGQLQHCGARGHHLTRLGTHRRDHPGGRRQQPGIAALVALGRSLGLGLFQLRLGRLQAGAAAVQLHPTDEALLLQGRETLPVRLRQIPLRPCGGHLGLRGLGGQRIVLAVDFGQHLPLAHHIAHIHGTPHQLAGHLKAQARFGLCPHIPGIFHPGLQWTGPHLQQLHRTHRLGRRRLARTGRQGQRHQRDNAKAQAGPQPKSRNHGGGKISY